MDHIYYLSEPGYRCKLMEGYYSAYKSNFVLIDVCMKENGYFQIWDKENLSIDISELECEIENSCFCSWNKDNLSIDVSEFRKAIDEGHFVPIECSEYNHLARLQCAVSQLYRTVDKLENVDLSSFLIRGNVSDIEIMIEYLATKAKTLENVCNAEGRLVFDAAPEYSSVYPQQEEAFKSQEDIECLNSDGKAGSIMFKRLPDEQPIFTERMIKNVFGD